MTRLDKLVEKYTPRPSDIIALPFMAIGRFCEYISEDLLDGPMCALDSSQSIFGYLTIGFLDKGAEIVGCTAYVGVALLKLPLAWAEDRILGERDLKNYFEDLYI